jgi:hypothetical protein
MGTGMDVYIISVQEEGWIWVVVVVVRRRRVRVPSSVLLLLLLSLVGGIGTGINIFTSRIIGPVMVRLLPFPTHTSFALSVFNSRYSL